MNLERPRLNPHRLFLARCLDVVGLNGLLLRLQSALRRPHLRIVNYHDVPRTHAPELEAQLRFFARHFVPASQEDLLGLLEGRWPHPRPGLLITFDDGVRSHFEVAAPLLERYGFAGWFFVPVAFPEIPVDRQPDYAREHRITPTDPAPDGRIAMTWEEIRQLDRRHVVGCHTMNHTRLSATLAPSDLDLEIAGAKKRMEERLGREVPAFCWVGGEESSYSAQAAEMIRRAGFRLSFMTNSTLVRPRCDPLQLQRTNVEVYYPPFLTRFQTSGLLDLAYRAKRRRVNRLTAAPTRRGERRVRRDAPPTS